MHGNITGTVKDAETSEPVKDVSVKLFQLYTPIDSTRTGDNGAYLLKNIIPGIYGIKASKFAYVSSSKNIEVIQAKTRNIDLTIDPIPVLTFSDTLLDFKLDITFLTFAISNIGLGTANYHITASQDWITVNPSTGYITNEIDSITVTIDKTSLEFTNKYKEILKVVSDFSIDTINIYVNGVMDRDGNYYKVVKIGTQTWMAENLNVGVQYSYYAEPANDGLIMKLCYNNIPYNCTIWGGIYDWVEAMDWDTSDLRTIRTTQGICSFGWHIPTENEWMVLINYLGGLQIAGGKLKESGTEHWLSPNTGATNESGFTALPGGYAENQPPNPYFGINSEATFWTATRPQGPPQFPEMPSSIWGSHLLLKYNNDRAIISGSALFWPQYYVRCLKDP